MHVRIYNYRTWYLVCVYRTTNIACCMIVYFTKKQQYAASKELYNNVYVHNYITYKKTKLTH